MKLEEIDKESIFKNYTVYPDGKIYSIKRPGTNGGYLNQWKNKAGYMRVTIYVNGITIQASVHRVVALYFIPNNENKPHINHKNGIKTDNNVSNLEWCTHSENMIHRCRVLGKKTIHSIETKQKMRQKAIGKDMSKAIAVSAKNRKGKLSNNVRPVILNNNIVYQSMSIASKKTGILITSISNNLKGLSKRTKVGIWQYAKK